MGLFQRFWLALAVAAVAFVAAGSADVAKEAPPFTDASGVSKQDRTEFDMYPRLSLDETLSAGQRKLMQVDELAEMRRRMRQQKQGAPATTPAASTAPPAPSIPVPQPSLFASQPTVETPAAPVSPQAPPLSPLANRRIEFHVHVVPHSHTDAGWIMSYHDYYNRRVRTIITTVVDTLFADEALRFIWADVGFFSVWWQEAPAELRARAKEIVDRGQLEFVNGGFVMNDEANVNYAQFLDQMALGHRFIKQTLNTTAQYGWCIDPFGHSSSQATMYAQLGMKAVVHARIDERMKKMQMNGTNSGDLQSAGLSFVWRANPAQHGVGSDIYTHIMPNGYTAANGLHWENEPAPGPRRAWKDVLQQSPSERLNIIRILIQDLAIYIKSMRTPHAILPWGSDFAFSNSRNMFANMRQLIHFMNHPEESWCQRMCTTEGFVTTMELPLMEDVLAPRNPGQPSAVDVVLKFRFSTLDEYFSAVHSFAYNHYKGDLSTPTATSRTLTSFFAPTGATVADMAADVAAAPSRFTPFRRGFSGWPVYSSEDLFPYADEYWRPPPNRLRWWTGYFASRPALKQFERRQYRSLRAAEAAMALAPGEGSLDVLPGVLPNSREPSAELTSWTTGPSATGNAAPATRIGAWILWTPSAYPFAGPAAFAEESAATVSVSGKMSQCAWVSPRARSLLAVARDIMAIMQHHDAITGTSPARTIQDYHNRLVRGHAAGVELLHSALARMLNTPSQLTASPQQLDAALTAALRAYSAQASAVNPEAAAFTAAARAAPNRGVKANGGPTANTDLLFFSPELSDAGLACGAHPDNGYAARLPELLPVAVYNPLAWEVPGQVLLLRNLTTRDVVVTDADGAVLDADVVPAELMEQDTAAGRSVLSLHTAAQINWAGTGHPEKLTQWAPTYTPSPSGSSARECVMQSSQPPVLFNVFVQLKKPLPALGTEVLTLYLNTHREPCCYIQELHRAGAVDYAAPPAFYTPRDGLQTPPPPPGPRPASVVFAAAAYAAWAPLVKWDVDGASCYQSIANGEVLLDLVGQCAPGGGPSYLATGVNGASLTTNVTATSAGAALATQTTVTEPFDFSFPYYLPHRIEPDGVYTLHINGDPVLPNAPPGRSYGGGSSGAAKSMTHSTAATQAIVYKGRVVQGFTQLPQQPGSFPFVHALRALRGSAGLDGGLQVSPLTRSQNQMLRFHTSVENAVTLDGSAAGGKQSGLPSDFQAASVRRVMYNDDLGLQMQRHFSDPTTNDAGSFYPFISRVAIRDEFPQSVQAHPQGFRGHRQLVVVAQQGAGAATPEKGALELMVNRYSDRDDELGMGEPLRDGSSFTFTYRVYYRAFSEAPVATPEDAYAAATSALLFGSKAHSDGGCGSDNYHAESVLLNNLPFVAAAPAVPVSYALTAAASLAPAVAPALLNTRAPLTEASPLVARMALTLASVATVVAARGGASAVPPTQPSEAAAPLLRFAPLAQPLPRCVHALSVQPRCDVYVNAIKDTTDPVLPAWPAPVGFSDYSDAVVAVLPASATGKAAMVRSERAVAGFQLPQPVSGFSANGALLTAPPPLPVTVRFINLDSRAIFRSSINSKALEEKFATLRPAGAANGVVSAGSAAPAALPLTVPPSQPLHTAFAFDLAPPVASAAAGGSAAGAGLVLRGVPQRVPLLAVAHAASPTAHPVTATVVPLEPVVGGTSPLLRLKGAPAAAAAAAAAASADTLVALTDSLAFSSHTLAPFCPLFPARSDLEVGRLGHTIPARKQPILQPYARDTPTAAASAAPAASLVAVSGSVPVPVSAAVNALLSQRKQSPRRAVFYTGTSIFTSFAKHLDTKLAWDAGSGGSGPDAVAQCTAALYSPSGPPASAQPLTLAAANPTLSFAASAGFSTVQRLRAGAPRAFGAAFFDPTLSVAAGAPWPDAANTTRAAAAFDVFTTFDASASSYFAPLPWCQCGYQHVVESAAAVVLRAGALDAHATVAAASAAAVDFVWFDGPTAAAVVGSAPPAQTAASPLGGGGYYGAPQPYSPPTFTAAESNAAVALYTGSGARADLRLRPADRGASPILPPATGSRDLPIVSASTASWVHALAPLHLTAHTVNVDKTAAAGGRGGTAPAATLAQVAAAATVAALAAAQPVQLPPLTATETTAAQAPGAEQPQRPVSTLTTPTTTTTTTTAPVSAGGAAMPPPPPPPHHYPPHYPPPPPGPPGPPGSWPPPPPPTTHGVPPGADPAARTAATAEGAATGVTGPSYVSFATVSDRQSPDGAVVIRVDRLFMQMLVVGGLLSVVGVLLCLLCLLVRAIPRRPGQPLSLELVLGYLRGGASANGYSRVEMAAGGDVALRGLRRGGRAFETDDLDDGTDLNEAASPSVNRRARV